MGELLSTTYSPITIPTLIPLNYHPPHFTNEKIGFQII